MPAGQIVNFGILFAVACYAFAKGDEIARIGNTKLAILVVLGGLAIFAQLVLNRLLPGGHPLTIGDVLLLKQFRTSTGLVLLGYILVLCGLIGLKKSLSSGEPPA
jgi:hypothetical protein